MLADAMHALALPDVQGLHTLFACFPAGSRMPMKVHEASYQRL